MSSSTFEVREAENEDETDRVLGFGLEPCEENGIPSSQGDSEVAKDHTYTKGPSIVSEDADKTEGSSESQIEVNENNEATLGKTRSTRAAKTPKGNKPSEPAKSRPKREPAIKKDSPIAKKSKGKKEILSEEGNTASEENVSDEKTDVSSSANASEDSGRPKRKGKKRKLEEKENVLDRSIVEEVENIVEDSSANDTGTESPAKKKATSVEATNEKKQNKAKQISGETEEDHNLPEGWVRKTVVRKSGKTAGQIDVYIYSPDGIKFRSRPDIAAYLARTKSPFKLDDFNFSKKKLSSNTTITSPTKKEKVTPVKKTKLSADRKKVQPVSPTKKGPKLLVKLNFSPKSKKARNTKTEKQSKATKTPVKSGKASGAGSKGSPPKSTVGRRRKVLKQDEQNEAIKTDEQDSKVSIDSSSAEETIAEQIYPSNMTNTITSRPQRSVNRKSAIEMLSTAKSVFEQPPVKRKSTVPAKKLSPKMEKVKQDVSHEDNPYNEKLIKRNKNNSDANDETSGTKRLRKQKSKVEEKENVLYKSIVEEVQNIAEASKSDYNVEKLSNKETLSTSYSSKDKIKNENTLSSGEKAVQKELPQGWKSKEVIRKSGKTAGLIDIYIFSPEGIKFRSKRDLASYLLKSKSDLKLEDFNFSKKSANQPLKSLDTKAD